MNIRICTPRIFGRAVLPAFLLLCSTFIFAHSNSEDTDRSAAAQWKPGAPQVQLEGQLEITYQDFKDGHSRSLYSLKQSDGTHVPLQFVKQPPTHLLTGTRVRVNGQRSGGSLLLYSGGNVKNTGGGGSTGGGTTTSSIPVPNTFGTQSVLVILVNFQDNAIQPYTAADAQYAVFSTANSFFMENSYQQTSLTGDVVGWYTIPVSSTTCDISQIATAAQNAATAAGVNLSTYARYVYFFPQSNACAFAGASNVGGNPSQSWLNGTLAPSVVNHELGHAIGLWHSHSLSCGTTTICSNGTIVEYGDNIDTMGYAQGPSPHYNAFQKERLGWLNYGGSPKIQTVTTSGTYTINPYEAAGPGPNALKVLQSTDPTTGAKTWYYLESRQAVGFDSFLTDGSCAACYTQNETTGILFHLGTDGNSNSSLALAMTPSNPLPGWFDDSLTVGQSFSDSTAGVMFTPTVVSSTGATLQITINGTSACTPANPSVSISPPQSQSVTSGTAVNFTVTVTDNDSSSCAPATFNLGSTVPTGWAGLWSAGALVVSSGKSGSATLTVTSPVGTSDGSYNIGVSAINASAGSYNTSATAAYVISSVPLSVSLTTNQPSYLAGQTVGVIVTMLYGTLPDPNASVTVTVMSPGGRATTLNGTTGSNGVALLSYKLSRHATPGTYQVQLGTAVSGASSALAAASTASAGASTSFTVQ